MAAKLRNRLHLCECGNFEIRHFGLSIIGTEYFFIELANQYFYEGLLEMRDETRNSP